MSGDRRVALVTGAGRGLGRAIADRLLADGWSVAAADLEPADLGSEHGIGCAVDVSSQKDVEAYVACAVERFGRIDAVVNNAGIGGPTDPVVETDPAEFMRVLAVNLLGPFLVARAAAPVMIAAGAGGRIVNIGSLFGQQAVADGAAYCSSKGGLVLLTQSLALELARYGITVNTVAPGNMWTAMHEAEIELRAAQSGRSFDDEREQVRRSVPLGRHGTGDDIAGAVSWLLGEDARYVTGQTVSVNGGVFLT